MKLDLDALLVQLPRMQINLECAEANPSDSGGYLQGGSPISRSLPQLSGWRGWLSEPQASSLQLPAPSESFQICAITHRLTAQRACAKVGTVAPGSVDRHHAGTTIMPLDGCPRCGR